MPSGEPGHQRDVRIWAFGTPIVVRFSAAAGADEAARAFEDAWAWCLEPSEQPVTSEPVVIDASLDDHEALSVSPADIADPTSDLSGLLHQLTSSITMELISARAGSLLMLHACALADPDTGATVVMAGPSGMGKTTIARTLGTSWGYLTDETAGIQPDMTVLPYPKPLSLLSAEWPAIKQQVAPASLGLVAPPDRCRLAAMILLDRSPVASAVPRVQRVPTVRALAEISEQTSYLRRMQRPLHVLADALNHCGGLLRVTYRDAEDLRPLVHDLLGSAS